MEKIVLSPFDDKRYLIKDSVKTLPHKDVIE